MSRRKWYALRYEPTPDFNQFWRETMQDSNFGEEKTQSKVLVKRDQFAQNGHVVTVVVVLHNA